MTHSPADHLTIDSAAARIAERNRDPAHPLIAPGSDADGSRTAAALRRAAELATGRVQAVQRHGAARWREISRLAHAAAGADERTAVAFTRSGRR